MYIDNILKIEVYKHIICNNMFEIYLYHNKR